jgi:transposase
MVKLALKRTQKHAIVASLCIKKRDNDLKMAYGSAHTVANEFKISVQTVTRVWKQWVDQKRQGVESPDLSPKFNKRGRHSLLTDEMRKDIEEILQDYASLQKYASREQIFQNLKMMGHSTCETSVGTYLKQMGVKKSQ